MPNGAGERIAGPVEAIAGIEQADDALVILGPLLDLVEIAVVRIERIVGFLIAPIGHAATRSTISRRTLRFCSSSRLRRSSSSSICGDDGIKWRGYIASISGSRLGKRRSFGPKTARMNRRRLFGGAG
jgi:hypothetical protein